MRYRQLGENGPTVSALGLGTMGMSAGMYGEVNDEESIATIHHALDFGITLVDPPTSTARDTTSDSSGVRSPGGAAR